MNVTREEAAQALRDIEQAGEKIGRMEGYRHGAPFFVVWGLVWLCANLATQFLGHAAQWAWPICVVVGIIVSCVLGVMTSRKAKSGATSNPRDKWIGQRIGLSSFVYMGFIFCLLMIAQPETGRQVNAMISVFFSFIYMAMGLWAGWRLFAIGAVTTAAIMFGFYFVGDDWFDLWMGVVGGGALILGGLWLWKA